MIDQPAGRRILIVDDDAGIRLLLRTFLRRLGYRMLEAGNGRDALRKMRAGEADLVVMDLMMPEVSGWDVLDVRAADPSLRRIPVIVITATNLNAANESAAGKGIGAVLAKPFDLDALRKAVTASFGSPHFPAPLAA
jgi:CheY-like chemotaxis protein